MASAIGGRCGGAALLDAGMKRGAGCVDRGDRDLAADRGDRDLAADRGVRNLAGDVETVRGCWRLCVDARGASPDARGSRADARGSRADAR